MKFVLVSISNIAFVLVIIGTVFSQNLINSFHQSKTLNSPGERAVKFENKENRQAEYTSFSSVRQDNARKLLIAEGSSTTEGYGAGNEYPRQLAVLFGGNYYKQTVNLILDSNNLWAVRNVGNSADSMIQMTAQYAAQVLPFYNPSLSVNYLTLQAGSNDVAYGRTTAALKNDVAAYVAKAKADGFVVGVCTIFHRVGNDVGKVSDYNNWLRGGSSAADFIIDLAAHPSLSDAADTSYFIGDGIHTNNAGQTVIAGIFARAIPTVGAASVTVTVSGRVMDSNGSAIEGAQVKITDSEGNTRMTTTSSFGGYTFDACQIGKTYILNASDNRYSFVPPLQILSLNGAVSEVNFVAATPPKARKRARLS